MQLPHEISRRAFVGGTVLAGAGLALGGMPAAAAVAAPAVIGCAAWGARAPSSPIVVLPNAPVKIIVHHTASPNSSDLSRAHAVSLVRSIQNFHMDHNHWIDSGQHFTITRGALVLEGRHRSVEALANGTEGIESAHCFGQNQVAIGIENEGTYDTVDLLPAHYAKLRDLCADICRRFGIRPYQIYGHRDFNTTACCGDVLYARLPKLRRDVAALLGGGATAAPVWPTVRSGDQGERVRTVQYLLRATGATLAPDGKFGPATDTAVRAFQGPVDAGVDGVVGNRTWNQLAPMLRAGASGEAVKAVQSQLVAHGAAITVDGAFGSRTATALRTFQKAHSLTADGVADPRTLAALVA